MSKVKDSIDALRAKLTNREDEAVTLPVIVTSQPNFDNTTYDVIPDPSTKSRAFLIVKLEYDLKTKQARVVEVRPFGDKAAGMTMALDKDNRKYLFERNKTNGEKK